MTSISVPFQSFAERLHLVFLRVHRLARLSPEHKTLVKIVRSSALPMWSLAITDPFTPQAIKVHVEVVKFRVPFFRFRCSTTRLICSGLVRK